MKILKGNYYQVTPKPSSSNSRKEKNHDRERQTCKAQTKNAKSRKNPLHSNSTVGNLYSNNRNPILQKHMELILSMIALVGIITFILILLDNFFD